MKRKIITTLLLFCMVATIFTGCGIGQTFNGGNNATDQKESSQTTGENSGSQNDSDVVDSTDEQSNEEEESSEKTEEKIADIAPGTDMAHASELPLYTKVENEIYSGQTHWYSFTTGKQDKKDYGVVLVNTTPGDEEGDHTLQGMVMDEFGEELGGGYHYFSSDGKPMTITIKRAEANTTYYVGITLENFREDSGYTLVVKQK